MDLRSTVEFFWIVAIDINVMIDSDIYDTIRTTVDTDRVDNENKEHYLFIY